MNRVRKNLMRSKIFPCGKCGVNRWRTAIKHADYGRTTHYKCRACGNIREIANGK